MPVKRITLRHVVQKPGFCGPAVLAMLFSYCDLEMSQDSIAHATGIPEDIMKDDGARIYELAEAVNRVSPGFVILGKYESSIDDLATLIEVFDLPVGVEWQGMFVDSAGVSFEEIIGHYCVVVAVDQDLQMIVMEDPDQKSALPEGSITFPDFVSRWWAENDIPISTEKNCRTIIRNDRLVFVLVTEDKVAALINWGMEPVSASFMYLHRSNR